jgi:hypothetical protein
VKSTRAFAPAFERRPQISLSFAAKSRLRSSIMPRRRSNCAGSQFNAKRKV